MGGIVGLGPPEGNDFIPALYVMKEAN